MACQGCEILLRVLDNTLRNEPHDALFWGATPSASSLEEADMSSRTSRARDHKNKRGRVIEKDWEEMSVRRVRRMRRVLDG